MKSDDVQNTIKTWWDILDKNNNPTNSNLIPDDNYEVPSKAFLSGDSQNTNSNIIPENKNIKNEFVFETNTPFVFGWKIKLVKWLIYKSLDIEYYVKNTSDNTIYLDNISEVEMITMSSNFNRNSIINITSSGDTLFISKSDWIPPYGFYTPQETYKTKLLPGESFSENITLNLPLKLEKNPYRDEHKHDLDVDKITTYKFWLWYSVIANNKYIKEEKIILGKREAYFFAMNTDELDKLTKNWETISDEESADVNERFIYSPAISFEIPFKLILDTSV